MIKRRAKDFLLNIAEQSGALRFVQYLHHDVGNHLAVLAYHRVAESDSPLSRRLYDLVSATPRQFEEQMSLLATCFNPVSAEDVLDAVRGDKPLPSQAVLVTVDDGYRDFKDVIFPIAQKYGIRPVLFVPTAYVGGGIFWWDCLYNAITHTKYVQLDTWLGSFPLKTAEQRQIAFDTIANYVRMQPFEKALADVENLCDDITPKDSRSTPFTLDWGELRDLSKAGATLAPHTHTHPIMTHISLEKAREELRTSLGLLNQEVGDVLPLFAYPDGRDHAVNDELALMLKSENIEIAFTMSDSLSRIKNDNLQLFPRLTPYSESLPRFHLKLTSFRSA